MLVIQAAVVTSLSVPAITSLTMVYDTVPEGRTFPYLEIGEIDETIDNTFGKNGRSLLVSLHIFSEQAGFKECETILEQVNILLDDGQPADPAGWHIIQSFYELGSLLKEFDGAVEIRHAIARYRFNVQQT